MKWKDLFSICLCLALAASVWAQSPAGNLGDSTKVNKLLEQSTGLIYSDPGKAISLAMQARELSKSIDYPKGIAVAQKNIGICYVNVGKYVEALDYWKESQQIFETLQDKKGVANMLSNIGVIYFNQGDELHALENYLKALEIAEKINDKPRIITVLNNIGNVYYVKKVTWDKALGYYLKAIPLCEELGESQANNLGAISVNVGSIYTLKGEYNKALPYLNKALLAYGNTVGSANAYNAIGMLYLKMGRFNAALVNYNQGLSIAEKLQEVVPTIQSLKGLANVKMEQKNYSEALSYYEKAADLAQASDIKFDLYEIYEATSKAYANIKDFGNAYRYHQLFAGIKDSLYNQETAKKLKDIQFDFDLKQKQVEINLLTKDKQLREVELERQRFAKNALMGGFVLLFVIIFIIFRNYRQKVKINKILDRQKDEIEHLLLNILPEEVASELKQSGQATPRDYESATVLFTDFKGFTTIADKMSPSELVGELNECFMAFDDIIERNNLEKIKTIGDSYMCAGGIPTPDPEHAHNVVKAGLEIQQYIDINNEIRAKKGLVPWHARVGIHSGPLVAGVVGKKKYAYDIWGSTVNIASRMESNGEPGKVNISAATYELVKEFYTCKYRGKIYAKNVGEVDMYFIEEEKPSVQTRHRVITVDRHPEPIEKNEKDTAPFPKV